MNVSVFIGTSVDGFIARPNGSLDFLPEEGGEPHGYKEFMASVDALVIGRNTFETVIAFPEWPYGDNASLFSAARPSACLRCVAELWNKWAGPRRKSFPLSKRAVCTTST
jgi:dihydrofolate reductase